MQPQQFHLGQPVVDQLQPPVRQLHRPLVRRRDLLAQQKLGPAHTDHSYLATSLQEDISYF